MTVTAREHLMPSDSITLKKVNMISGKPSEDNKTEFSVISVIGEGGSSVCYDAFCEGDGSHGRLKEFYPSDLGDGVLTRNSDNQLVISENMPGAKLRFEAGAKSFMDAYCTLAGAKNKSYGEVLNNYVVPFEIYTGSSSVYIWTRHDKRIKSFGEYLENVRDDIRTATKPEHHLFNILTALLTLTKCISALHIAGLVHGDIKPDNFGLSIDVCGEIDAGNISLFDINTVFPAGDDFIHTSGTQGFTAPEVKRGKMSCRSDIYSIGASLFNAIVFSENFDEVYCDEYYNDIDHLLADSSLIKSSDNNSGSALHDTLSEILKSSLAPNPENRYKACSYLAKDIAEARAFLLPEEARSLLSKLGQDIKIVNAEEYLDKEIPSGATGALQRLLIEHPLYENSTSENIDVLVVGAGTYSQKFMDIAFEASQTGFFNLRVTAISANVNADRNRYLKARPAFKKFFTVDGEKPCGFSLGSVDFVQVEKTGRLSGFLADNRKNNRKIIEGVTQKFGDRNFSYVFIALGNDELNIETAKACQEVLGKECKVYFACYKGEAEVNGACPVYVNKVIEETEYYKEIKRMAFNCHLLWNSSLGVDLNKLMSEFALPYNFNASVSYVLSIKYKLHSLGIDNMTSVKEAARLFEEKLLENPELYSKLCKYEHFRWTVSYICKGWDVLEDYSKLNYDTKDKRNKLHPCIVGCEAGTVLDGYDWQKDNLGKWDTAQDAELDTLDELDRVSVKLHRHFKKCAEGVKNLSGIRADIDKISQALTSYPDVSESFERLVFCMREISCGKTQLARLYSSYSKAFRLKMKELPCEILSETEKNLDIIEKFFYPVLVSSKHTDYKAHDCRLVSGIPFILTYSTNTHLIIPFDTKENSLSSLANVTSSMVLNPSKITYVVSEDDLNESRNGFFSNLEHATRCMDRRNMQASVDIFVLEHSKKSDLYRKELKKEIRQKSGRIRKVYFAGSDDCIQNIIENNGLCAVEKNNTTSSQLLGKWGVYDKNLSYVYDFFAGVFDTFNGCDFAKYVKTEDYLRASDFVKKEMSFPMEMQNDVYYLKSLADETGYEHWGGFSNHLNTLSEQKSLLLKVDTKYDSTDSCEKTFLSPAFCRNAMEKILYSLNKAKVISDTKISFEGHSLCKFTLKASQNIHDSIGLLLSNPYRLTDASKIYCLTDADSIRIYFDDLRITGDDNIKVYDSLLNNLSEKSYILGYSKDSCCFAFASYCIKQLLTKESRIFEAYTYFRLLESGRFDDVAIVYDNDSSENLVKIVLTRGFRLIIAKCEIHQGTVKLLSVNGQSFTDTSYDVNAFVCYLQDF